MSRLVAARGGNALLRRGQPPEAGAYQDVEPYPLDVLGAVSKGMIGHLDRAGVVRIAPLALETAR